jgi:RsiW-degrading membrane proteinase PrsW (M82 family)
MDIWLAILSILPSLLIAAFLFVKDKSREPGAYLILAFILGMVSIIPAWLLEQLWHNYAPLSDDSLAGTLVFAFIGIALMEEVPKFLFLRIGFYPRTFFDEPLDGIVYAGMIGMGFAMVENLLYAVEHGMGTTILRAFTAVPAHAVFAVLMGYYMGLAKFDRDNHALLMRKSLLWAVLIHGLYDFFLIQNFVPGLIGLAILVLYISIYFSMRLIRMHQAVSNRYTVPVVLLQETPAAQNPLPPPPDEGLVDEIIRDMQEDKGI